MGLIIEGNSCFLCIYINPFISFSTIVCFVLQFLSFSAFSWSVPFSVGLSLPQVLLTLPEASRLDYFPLLSAPLLMLEQLLMNLKVEWADVAVRTLRNLLLGQEAGFNNEDIDKLLSNYGQKALEFSCAPRQMSRSGGLFLPLPFTLNGSIASAHLQDQLQLKYSHRTHGQCQIHFLLRNNRWT